MPIPTESPDTGSAMEDVRHQKGPDAAIKTEELSAALVFGDIRASLQDADPVLDQAPDSSSYSHLPPMPHPVHEDHHEGPKNEAWTAAWRHVFVHNPEIWLESHAAEFANAFGDFGGHLMCIDEGAEPQAGEDAVYLAGSGILFKHKELHTMDERLDAAAAELRGSGTKSVCSHKGCGAAGIAAKELGSDDPEALAVEWSTKLAARLGVPYTGHMTELRRPDAFHDALVVYVDGTGRFEDPERAGLPRGFTVSRGILKDGKQGAAEAKLAYDIAHGAHGFGKRFNAEKPFTVVVIGDSERPEYATGVLLQEIHDAFHGNPNVRIVSVDAPRQVAEA